MARAQQDGHQDALLQFPETPPSSPDVNSAVARVALDVPSPHLDRLFDYLVPSAMDDTAVPGARVMVRFAGRERSGFIVERSQGSAHEGALAPLRRVVSPVPVLIPELVELCRGVADYYGGTFMDVVRLAVPARHARTENAVLEGAVPERTGPLIASEAVGAEERMGYGEQWVRRWRDYVGGPAMIRHLVAGGSPRALWQALPWAEDAEHDCQVSAHDHWMSAVADAAAATLESGRGVIIVVPTADLLPPLRKKLEAVVGQEPIVQLTAEDGPAARYRAFMNVLTGAARVAIGTRTAAFAPVRRLGLVACWDDGDENHAERRAPYPHARQVLALRSAQARAGLLLAGWSRSVASQAWIESGWVQSVAPTRTTVRARTPRVAAPSEDELARFGAGAFGRIPAPAWSLLRQALEQGPVLVSVPRAGYVPMVVCAGCREAATCVRCHGPIGFTSATAVGSCRRCGLAQTDWRCPACESRSFRAVRVGSGRTAEELGRAFPHVPVLTSAGDSDHGVAQTVDERPRLVIATPGAEPTAARGYSGALILDAALTSGLATLEAGPEAVRRWFAVAGQVRPAATGGRVMILGSPAPAPAQALVRWDPVGFTERELDERRQLDLPPASAAAALTGSASAMRGFLAAVPSDFDVLGPTVIGRAEPEGSMADQDEPDVRAVVRCQRSRRAELSRILRDIQRMRSARKEPVVRVQLDPTVI